MPKRFVFIVEDLYGGGAQKVLLNTAEGLRQRGHHVKVFLLIDRRDFEPPVGLSIENLNLATRFVRSVSWSLVDRWVASKIEARIQQENPDVVITCSCDRFARFLSGENIFHWIHSSILNNRRGYQRAKRKALQFYSGRRLICVSEGIKHELLHEIHLKPRDIRVIYNPFDALSISVQAKGNSHLQLPTKYFVSVGRIEPRKRLDRMLRAYAQSGAQSDLVIVGTGHEKEISKLKKLAGQLSIQTRVHWLGFLKNPYPVIRQAQALLLTSDREGLPTVLIESLICRTPVISVDCPTGPSEILIGRWKEFLVPMTEEKNLAEAIGKMDQQRPEVQELDYRRFLSEETLPQFEKLTEATK